MNTKRVLCIGETLWDKLPSGAKAGGAPMNVALHLQKFGLNVSFVSKVGSDKLGASLIDFITNAGLNTISIQTDTVLPTSEVLVHLGESNQISYEICEPVAWDNIEFNKTVEELANNTDYIIYGTLASRNETSKNTIHKVLESDAYKVIDVNLRPPYGNKKVVVPLLEKANLAKLNDEELECIAGWFDYELKSEKEGIEWFAKQFNCDTVCVTKGDKGAVLLHNNEFYQHSGFKVSAVDAVGAGDAFLAGLIHSLSSKDKAEHALQFACATGAFVATKTGATPDYNFEEINKILATS